ncbi:MAG TPA: hypothetical protein VIH60_07920 [Steroidobacteraceae bacterium]|jgi:hypothetical protein
MSYSSDRRLAAALAAALLCGCAGNGEGLDDEGQPVSAGNAPAPLTADFQSIQDNVFTPICTRCHSGAGAPEGLQLDAQHSYALLVGVPSTEQPQLLRVDPGSPDESYLVLKLQGSAGIVGAQMPFGGPYLDSATIDVIRQWIANGAPPADATTAAAHFAVSSVSPSGQTTLPAPQIVLVLNHEPDASLINYTTLRLDRLTANGAEPASDSLSLQLAKGNPRALLITPGTPLTPGHYQLSVRGTGGAALADQNAETLERDYRFEFTVSGAR